ncbi:MAG: peptide ABC transporter substrate-binding protein, partial [Tissierellia bacterium]|nr:peptide ABC transporter substrate-binding protein [Tissierellia bacterium]
MKKLIPLILVLTLVLTSCGTSKTGTDSADYKDVQEYNTVYSGEITTLNYLVTASTAEFSLAANFVDTLIDFDRYGVVTPCLATSWEESDDGLTWTLQIREGVKWYTHTGEEYADVTAHDWVDAAKYLLNPENESRTANIFYSVIENAEEYYNGEIDDFEQVGVKALGDYELQYK